MGFEFSLFPGRDLHVLLHCSLSFSNGAAHPTLPLPSVWGSKPRESGHFIQLGLTSNIFSMSSQAALLKTLMNLYEFLSFPEVVERIAAVCRSYLESVPDFMLVLCHIAYNNRTLLMVWRWNQGPTLPPAPDVWWMFSAATQAWGQPAKYSALGLRLSVTWFRFNQECFHFSL